MFVGRKTAYRWIWIAGAALIIVDIAKLLVIDLADSGTITRIISFFVAGLFLLFIGWAVPLPAKETKESNA
jgi:uncharacterized membrane protein